MTPPRGSAAIFVLPTTTVDQWGPVAGWISTSGWATAAQRQLGRAWIVTRHGVLGPDEVRRRATQTERSTEASTRRWSAAVPTTAKTMLKDAREARRARQFRVDPNGPWTEGGGPIAFVWQRHELFHTAGIDLADALGVPSVLFVPAMIVWQAREWSVRRPGWGTWLERRAEHPAVMRASLVACGTELIAEQVRRLGVPEARILVTPTGADLDLFDPRPDREASRRDLGVGDEFVIGWAGSFRAFHALDQLVRAAAMVPGAHLLFVGDGPERASIEQLAVELGVKATFTGVVPHEELPRLLVAMDVGVVLSREGQAFHYSPLKVAEYMAAGVPVVAPDHPQLRARLEDGGNALFYPPADVDSLGRVLAGLAADRDRTGQLAAGARRSATEWSWDRQVQRVRDALSG